MREKRNYRALLLAMAVALSPTAPISAADDAKIGRQAVIRLWDGDEHAGTIREWGDQEVTLETPEGKIVFPRAQIKKLELQAAPPAGPGETSSIKDSAEKSAWKQRLNGAKSSRAICLVLGVGGIVAGTASYLQGQKDNQSAGDIPGCNQSGSTAYCSDSASTARAQALIDSGDKKMAKGLVLDLVGLGFALGSWAFSNKAERLEKEGRRKGFTLVPGKNGKDGVQLAYVHPF